MQNQPRLSFRWALALIPLLSASPLHAKPFPHGEATHAYLPLAPESAEVFSKLGKEALEEPASGRVPNYLRAIAHFAPNAVQPFAHLFKTVVHGGTVAPETKTLMGMAIAKENGSTYLVAHLKRLLLSSESGRKLYTTLGNTRTGEEGERIAVRYAIDLTKAVHGVSDAEFAQARALYNDAQLVELTAVTCFFNYFARFCQGAGLPLESWLKEPMNASPSPQKEHDDLARVTIASDEELQMGTKLLNPAPELKRGLGIGIANSQRAMLRVPDIGEAWWSYMRSTREGAKLTRENQLHISFAVSMANGCRYCTVHQVVGLKRLGVDIAKLVAMQKSDSALSPLELALVTFARRLTKSPKTMQEADYTLLQSVINDERATFDALLQTCTFSFMNRFTDGLRLPSEDEAVKTYQEVYGEGSYKAYPTR